MKEINKKIKVSIVIPVYNVELYLKEALDSVINQTMKDLEIIIVNDGSTDNSLNIIKEYEKKDTRIKVINQKNKGLSEARNSGLKIARGKYIYFMDSDDYIELDTLNSCYEEAEKNNLDFLFFDADSFTVEKIKINNIDYDRSILLNTFKVAAGSEYLENLLKNKIYKSPVWLNFIQLEFLKKIDLKFYPRIYHEDELFSFILYLRAKRVSYINRKFFKRRVRSNSIMRSQKSEKNLIGYLTVVKELRKYKDIEKLETNIKLLEERIQDLLGRIISILSILDSDIINKYKKILNKEKFDFNKKNKIKLKYLKILGLIYRWKECKTIY